MGGRSGDSGGGGWDVGSDQRTKACAGCEASATPATTGKQAKVAQVPASHVMCGQQGSLQSGAEGASVAAMASWQGIACVA
jgi:hypothetical protein